MMEQESHFYIGSLSHAGAIGLMQLMPDTARIVGVDPYLPLDNILGGVAARSLGSSPSALLIVFHIISAHSPLTAPLGRGRPDRMSSPRIKFME